MRKIILGILILSIILIGNSWGAIVTTEKQGGRAAPIYQRQMTSFVETIDNVSGDYLVTNISTSTIIPGSHHTAHNILGYTVMSLTGHVVNGTLITGGSENVLSVWDAIATTVSPSMVGPEIESIDGTFDGYLCPRPKPIAYGITTHQGANTRIQILYE